MISADQALMELQNRTAAAYVQSAPAFITYREVTHARAPSLGRSQDINRYVAVRQTDDFAVMRDLPQGMERTGKAFPIIPYFDPLSQWSFNWFANLKNVVIDLTRYPVGQWMMPKTEPDATMNVAYFSFWNPTYFPDSTEARLHLSVMPTPLDENKTPYFPDIVVDPQTHLPSHFEIKFVNQPDDLTLDYSVIEGHWILTHATYTAPQHAGPFSFTVVSETTYSDITFPATAPDPRLAGTPAPTPTPPG